MSLYHHQSVDITRRGIARRSFLQTVSAGAVAAGTLNFRELMSVQAAELRKQGMAVIVLWMQGGPSHFETFDPKPGTETGGPTEAIETAVSGIRVAKGWEKVASAMKHIALVRSMTNKEGNHQRATYQMHTGYVPSGSVRHPSLGSNIARELGDPDSDLPSIVSIGGGLGRGGIGAGFLGVHYEPFLVNQPGQMPQNLANQVSVDRYQTRLGLLGRLQDDFAERGGKQKVADHQTLYKKAARLVLSPNLKAFELGEESAELKAAYGDTQFGRGCLLARRLVETGVTYIEVRSGNWDTHNDNFNRITQNAAQVDPGFAALVNDLHDRGMLERTVVLWGGEFGRTPRVNPRTGRDHYPRAFNMALAGGGIPGGQVIGGTSPDGSTVKTDPVTINDLLSTICKIVKVDSSKENMSPLGRPIKIVDGGTPIKQMFA